MALAHSQAYTFYHSVHPYDGNPDYINNKKDLYHVKEAFKAAGWTVMGSYDGRNTGNIDNSGQTAFVDGLGGGAGVDHWDAPENIDPVNTSHDVWIVLQCPPIMGDIQVMIGSNYLGGGVNNLYRWDTYFSPSGSFLDNNGGTNGTTGAYPTAPDQVQPMSDVQVGQQDGRHSEVHACWSADKSQLFIIHTNEMCPCSMLLAFCKLDNAHADLQGGMAWFMESHASNTTNTPVSTVLSNSHHYTTANWHGVINGTYRTLYLGGRGWNNVGLQSQLRYPINNKATVGPCELYASAVTARGYYGTLSDMYWMSNNHFGRGLGDAVGGPINWYSGGSLIIPWDSTQPLPRVR